MLPSGMSAPNVAKPAGRSTKTEIRLASVLNGSVAAYQESLKERTNQVVLERLRKRRVIG